MYMENMRKAISKRADVKGDIGLPANNSYTNEINYFTDCFINNTCTDSVKSDEFETVIDVLNIL